MSPSNNVIGGHFEGEVSAEACLWETSKKEDARRRNQEMGIP